MTHIFGVAGRIFLSFALVVTLIPTMSALADEVSNQTTESESSTSAAETATDTESSDTGTSSSSDSTQNSSTDGSSDDGSDSAVVLAETEEEADSLSDESTMTEEDFYSEFRGTSWRYNNGELIQSRSLIQTLTSSTGVTWTKQSDGVYVASDGSTVSGATGIGIDVSKWQGSIDWAKVKAAGIDFAIIRCGYGQSGDDEYFTANVKGCIENGIPFGIYLYSYAYDESTALKEAQHVLDLLEEAGLSPSDVDLPIYYDLENQNSSGKPAGINSSNSYVTISNSTLATMAKAFCDAIESEGYEAGVYANLNWWNNYLTSSTFDSYSRWVAQYPATGGSLSCSYTGDYDYWQCMSTGSVSGISGNVDINFSYAFSTPQGLSATAAASGTKISWDSVYEATGYAVYRKVSGGSWSMIATTTSTSYTDTEALSAGETYYYTVRAYRGDEETALANKYDSEYWTSYNKTGVSARYLAIPSLSSATKTSTGTKISWSSVSSATGYAIYRKASGGSWSLIATTTSTSYTDKTSLTSGTTYYYTVRAYIGSAATSNKYDAYYWSGYDSTGVSSSALTTPTLKSATAAASGTKITWSSVSGATGYAVYRKVSGGSWTMLDTTTSTSYTDTEALSAGKTYYYTVRAYAGDVDTAKSNKYSAQYWSYFDTTGVDARYLATPTLSSAATASGGTKISWSSVSSATGYAVYRKQEGSSSWTLLGTTTSTSYTDKSSLSSGTTYYYTVRAYIGSKATSNKYDAYYWSGYDTEGVSSSALATPTLKSATAAASGTKITWSSVSGATGYAVYRKVSGGSWSMIATTTSTSYTDTASLSAGKTYYYTVRAYKGDVDTAKSNKYSAQYWSYFDTTGVSFSN